MFNTLNIERLRTVQQHILEEPRRLNMDHWIQLRRPNNSILDFPPCGTVACIAGWTYILFQERNVRNAEINFSQFRAAELLGLDIDEDEEYYLFYPDKWLREDLADRYRKATSGSQEAAQAVSDYIDYVIETATSNQNGEIASEL